MTEHTEVSFIHSKSISKTRVTVLLLLDEQTSCRCGVSVLTPLDQVASLSLHNETIQAKQICLSQPC